MEIGITCGVNWTTRKVCSRNDLRFRRSQRSGRLVGNPIGIGINLLCCSHGHAELEALALRHLGGYLLQAADNCDSIQVIEITQMGNAEQLALHVALSVGDHGVKHLAEALHEYA